MGSEDAVASCVRDAGDTHGVEVAEDAVCQNLRHEKQSPCFPIYAAVQLEHPLPHHIPQTRA